MMFCLRQQLLYPGLVVFPELQKTVRIPEKDAEALRSGVAEAKFHFPPLSGRIMLQELGNLAGLAAYFEACLTERKHYSAGRTVYSPSRGGASAQELNPGVYCWRWSSAVAGLNRHKTIN